MKPTDNIVLRLLTEIRAKQDDDGLRLQRVERRLDELHESVGMSLGFSAHATQVTEGHGEHFDKVDQAIAELKRRVATLEQSRP